MLLNTTKTPSTNTTDVDFGGSFVLPEWGRIMLYVGYGYIFLSGIVGNSIVLGTTLFKGKGKRKSSDQQIISLAIADLLGSIFVPTVMIHDLVTNLESWELLGLVGCKLFPPMTVLTTIASAWMMVAIAVARFRIIKRSTQIQGTTDIFNIIGILQAWVVAVLIAAPYAYHMQTNDGLCWDTWNTPEDQFIWTTMLFVSWLIIPMLILLVVYPASFKLLRQKTFSDSSTASTLHSKRNKKIAKMFSTIIIAFFVLTTPYAIFFFIWAYVTYYDYGYFMEHLGTFLTCNYILYFIASLNSTINPFIYAQTQLANYRKRRSAKKSSANTSSTKETSVSGSDNKGFSKM